MNDTDTRETKKYLYNTIIEKIRDMIRSGELKPGDRLPPERKLAEDFGVSRNSLRQAIQAMSERRLIESRQGDGNYISPSVDSSFFSDNIIDAIIEQKGFLRDILELRQVMEPQIAFLAAERVTPDQIDSLKILVCDQHRAVIDHKDADFLDSAFHLKLAEYSGNRVISQVMKTIRSVINETRSGWLQTHERRLSSVEGHLRIIDALESGSPDKAFEAMKKHLLEVEQHILGDA